jgi:hypothetical protein
MEATGTRPRSPLRRDLQPHAAGAEAAAVAAELRCLAALQRQQTAQGLYADAARTQQRALELRAGAEVAALQVCLGLDLGGRLDPQQ